MQERWGNGHAMKSSYLGNKHANHLDHHHRHMISCRYELNQWCCVYALQGIETTTARKTTGSDVCDVSAPVQTPHVGLPESSWHPTNCYVAVLPMQCPRRHRHRLVCSPPAAKHGAASLYPGHTPPHNPNMHCHARYFIPHITPHLSSMLESLMTRFMP